MQALIDFEGWRKWRGFANLAKPQTTSAPTSTPINQPSSVHNIANAEPAAAPVPLQRRSQPNVAGLSGNRNDNLDLKGNSSPESSGLKGMQGSPGGSGKESPASSSSTVIANGEANAPGGAGPAGGRNIAVSVSTSTPGRRINRNSGSAIPPRSVWP
jgi:osomolarity two-component system response regulator SSK1